MPNTTYHEEKRNRFRDTAAFLMRQNNMFSYDSNVQDCFYSAVHEAERFLAELNLDGRGHRRRENLITNFMVLTGRRIMSRDRFARNPGYPSDRLFDRDSEAYYMELVALRLDVVYGNNILGQQRHASLRDVQRAMYLMTRFFHAINSHEQGLRSRGII